MAGADGQEVAFPPGTTYEVTLADDASLANDGDQPESLRQVALRGWAAMLLYVGFNGSATFSVQATLPNGDWTMHRVRLDQDALREAMRRELGIAFVGDRV